MISVEQILGLVAKTLTANPLLTKFGLSIEQAAIRWRPLRVILATLAAVTRNDAQQLTAGVAYYGLVFVIPISVGILQVFGAVLGTNRSEDWYAKLTAGLLPAGIDLRLVAAAQDPASAGVAAALALIGLTWGSYKLFGAVGVVVNRMWGIEPTQVGVFARTREFMYLSGTAFALLVSSVLIYLMTQDLLPRLLREVHLYEFAGRLGAQIWWSNALAWMVSSAAFLMIYRYVPERRVMWRWATLSACSAGIAFTLVSDVFALFLGYVAPSHSLYGPLASLLVFLIWMFVTSLILAFGAAISAYSQSIYHNDGPIPGPGWFLK